ncbi:RNase E specificity factor CsrD [Shewanella corallii]|uniref:RNase E specificity factor CsrD n=1 Tax=Shewanella corallii TaxID=560080 RepID=A0ABT0N1B7_9GAMM|nr:RNase E specificity factor CsrD [Shewanella corallii]MCL2912238.1 RNase E specificity factor CsrD [Shewanella corallii]
MKLTRMLTKKLVSFWIVSLAAVAFLFMLFAFFSYVHLTSRFQQHQVDELQSLLIVERHEQRNEHVKEWLPSILQAYDAQSFDLLENGKVIYSYRAEQVSGRPVLYLEQLSVEPDLRMRLELPRPFTINTPDWQELSIIGVTLLFLILLVTYGQSWLRKQMMGIEELSSRSQLILAGDYQKAAKAEGNGQPKLINKAITELLNALEDASVERTRFDQFIRTNTFLDPETRVGNRLFLNNRLEALSYQQRMIVSGTLYLIMLEGLETYKKKQGEQELSELLDLVIDGINKVLSLQPNSLLARRASNQFAVVVPQFSLAEADHLAERLLKLCVSQLDLVTRKKARCYIGAAYFREGDPVHQLMEEAEMSLKAAQLQEASNWFMYDKGAVDEEFAKGSVRWRSLLETALAHRRVYAYGQSVVDIDNNVLHTELFSRIKDAQGKMIRANQFVPMANKVGLMPRIERQLIELVLTQVIPKYPDAYFSVNLSLDSLQNKAFVHWLTGYLLEHRAHIQRLIIEISEEVMVRHGDKFKSVLQMIKTMGAKLCVDNVGQDVVSVHYMSEYKVDLMKLHRSIIRQIHLRPENQLFVRSLIGGLYRTNVTVLAEGVELFEEWQTLQILGVSGGQGKFFGSPEAV